MPVEIHLDPYTELRDRMVSSQLRARGLRDERVLAAMSRVPRHEFVAGNNLHQAYDDHPIAIDEGQTISQPYIVAAMLQALALQPADVVLEVGTGSGYQTAILAELVHHVFSIERYTSLAESARARLNRLGHRNVTVVIGDGSRGLPNAAPFDAIAVSAAAPRIPVSLNAQLRDGGRMVIPVGPSQAQELQLVLRQGSDFRVTVLDGCRFVPLVGAEAYPTPE